MPTFIPGVWFDDDGPSVDNEILDILKEAEGKVYDLLDGRRLSYNPKVMRDATKEIAETIAESQEDDECQDHYAVLSAISMMAVLLSDIEFDTVCPEDN